MYNREYEETIRKLKNTSLEPKEREKLLEYLRYLNYRS